MQNKYLLQSIIDVSVWDMSFRCAVLFEVNSFLCAFSRLKYLELNIHGVQKLKSFT